MSNYTKRNVLHLAAMHASTDTMDVVSAASLRGLDPDARDRDGHTPNECFLKCRHAHCAVARQSLDVERESWSALMQSTRGDTPVLLNEDENDQDWMATNLDAISCKHEDLCSVDEISIDSMSEHEFVDAEDVYEDIAGSTRC